MQRRSIHTLASTNKLVWIKTSEKECITTALECGLAPTLLVDSGDTNVTSKLPQWRQLGRIETILAQPDGSLVDDSGASIGTLQRLLNPSDLAAAQESAESQTGFIIMDAADWQIIPAENLVAAFQSKTDSTLLAIAKTAADSQVMLEALEIGTDGIVIETNDPTEIRALAAYLEQREAQEQAELQYEVAQVTTVRPVASGDRACVDLCSNMVPGEGLLVGNFARGLFLVHSECEESGYINSRPFRVNAGPVHAYVQIPGGLTRYLAELKSGDEVEIADAAGRRRKALVGRVKIEKRPLVLVEAATKDGVSYSILLQNAETVKLVGPQGSGEKSWRAISVSALKPGDEVYVLVQNAARHTGVSIEESITEK